MYKIFNYIIKLSMIKHNRNVVYVLIVMIIIGVLLSFILINKKVSPIMRVVAQDESKKVADIIINDAVKKELDNGLTFDKLFIITYDNDKISTIDFDSIIINRLLNNVSNNILVSLRNVENGNINELEMLHTYNMKNLKRGIIYEIPLTYSYNNVFLSNLSPKIPVRIHPIGNINSKIRTEVTNYGINNALIEVYIDIEVNMQVVLPILTDTVNTKTSIPVALKLFKGEVPTYFGGLNGSNNFTLPIE